MYGLGFWGFEYDYPALLKQKAVPRKKKKKIVKKKRNKKEAAQP